MEAERTSYGPETKAAVMAALLAGQSVSSVAREYKLPKGTVSGWKRQAERRVEEGVAPTATQKSRVSTLLVAYLEKNLEALAVQAEVFADPAWIREQGAAELATLHGVMTDKAVRLIEAFGRAEEEEADAV
jgi:transposase-like protein